MRIFSNFDTEFQKRLIDEKKKSLWDGKMFVIHRSRFYLYFKVIGHFLGYFTILISMIVFLNYIQALTSIYFALISVWFLMVWFRIVHKLLKYLFDFTIVSPKGIITYKQKWILHNQMKEIPAGRIKAIQISRSGIFGNIFCYGYVDIIADLSDNAHLGADDEAPWVTGLTYVDNPFQVKAKISDCCFK